MNLVVFIGLQVFVGEIIAYKISQIDLANEFRIDSVSPDCARDYNVMVEQIQDKASWLTKDGQWAAKCAVK